MSDTLANGDGIVEARHHAGGMLRRASEEGLPYDVRHFFGLVAGTPAAGWHGSLARLADLVDGTCANVAPSSAPWFECSECHGRITVTDVAYEEPTTWKADGTGTVPAFCPVCGRRILWDEEGD